jgi:hypothetical protein
VKDDRHEQPARFEHRGRTVQDRIKGVHVHQRQHARGRVERFLGLGQFGHGAKMPCIADGQSRPMLSRQVGGEFPGGLDELARGVDARARDAELCQSAAQHALAAGDVQHPLAGEGLKQAHDARQDDVLVEVAAFAGDESLVPSGDVVPPARLVRAAARSGQGRPGTMLTLLGGARTAVRSGAALAWPAG